MGVAEHPTGEVDALARGYNYDQHLKSHVSHTRLVSDALLDVAGLAGTPADVLPRFRALWQETFGKPPVVANRRAFERLPDDLRATAQRLLNEGAVKQRQGHLDEGMGLSRSS